MQHSSQGLTNMNSHKEDALTAQAFVTQSADAAKIAQRQLAQLNTLEKNAVLLALAEALVEHADDISQANALDIKEAAEHGMDAGKLDRLLFNRSRILQSAQNVRNIAQLADPVGEIVQGYTLPNGLQLSQVRVPLGVIGMIYEARPNVTIDVVALCVKSGNAVILRGGSAARRTNELSVRVIQKVLRSMRLNDALISSVDRYGRLGATAMMHAHGHIDVLVPRGSAELIQTVVRESNVPVIETGAGNVHIYVDQSADMTQAINIVLNAKTQRVGVCNAAEKLLIHRSIAPVALPLLARALVDHQVQMHVDDEAYAILSQMDLDSERYDHASEEDWEREYLSLQIGVKIVGDVHEAVEHIAHYSTGHTESIIAEDYATIETFVHSVDSAVVLVNASTRFTDGGEFGFGAELGISTQKLHARGPMGLKEMTTTQWVGYGQGQVRA